MHNKPVCVERQPNKGTMRNANKQNPEFGRVQQKTPVIRTETK